MHVGRYQPVICTCRRLWVPLDWYLEASTFALLDRLLREFKHALRLRQRGSELSIANWCLKK